MRKGMWLYFISAPLMMLAATAVQADSLKAELHGYNEVPTLSTPAAGQFRARINRDETEIQYELSYAGFTTPVLVAHLHLGKRAVNGGVSVFICANNGTGPVGTPACPVMEGTVTGMWTPASVVGPAGQGIAPGEWQELIRALRADAVYANVHSQTYPAGEIRDQVDVKHRHNHD
jgi:hypothetical protein